jgi:hypothetical protein
MIIKEKILINFPVIYSELIYDNLSDACRDRTEFITQAVEEKFEREQIIYKAKINFRHMTKEQIEDVEDFLKNANKK